MIAGKRVTAQIAREHLLGGLEREVRLTLASRALGVKTVIDAADTLSRSLGEGHTAMLSGLGIGETAARDMIAQARETLSREHLEQKIARELGPNALERVRVNGVTEAWAPLGALAHISAGNAAGLPAYSVLEGLLTGNVNLLKLPGGDDGLSFALLDALVRIEPALSGFIYVFDIPSSDAEAMRALLRASDAAAVWGSGEAVAGIRALAPPRVQLIEWGHRASFAYVTHAGETPEALAGIARDVCASDQLLCSSPQCVYYGADEPSELAAFGRRLFEHMRAAAASHPRGTLPMGVQAEITHIRMVARAERALGKAVLFEDDSCAVIVPREPEPAPWPAFRNVLVMRASIGELADVLAPLRGCLQSAYIACGAQERARVTEELIRAGVSRVRACGGMAQSYAGEPHDGVRSLSRYALRISVNDSE